MLRDSYKYSFHAFTITHLYAKLLSINPNFHSTANDKLIMSVLKGIAVRIHKHTCQLDGKIKVRFTQTEVLALHQAYMNNMLRNMTPDFMQFITEIDQAL